MLIWADRFLRALYREATEGSAQIRAMVDRLIAMEEDEHERLTFQRARSGWKATAARASIRASTRLRSVAESDPYCGFE